MDCSLIDNSICKNKDGGNKKLFAKPYTSVEEQMLRVRAQDF